jgi:hypothetical protein
MSYSYIKNVFPNFDNNSDKLYNEPLYQNIENTIKSEKDKNMNELLQPKNNSVENKIEFDLSPNKLLEQYSNHSSLGSLEEQYMLKPNEQKEQNNLKFYNLPINKEYLRQISRESLKDLPLGESNYLSNIKTPVINSFTTQDKTIEKFESSNQKNKTIESCNFDCDVYTKHILECSKCKNLIMKQFGIENDKIRNEEIMELISYFIFALFILLLIDSLKK